MTWLFTLLAMTVIALVAGVVTGRIGGGMNPPESSLPFRGLPQDAVVPEDLEALRFTPALRGYRMNQVDDVLDQLGRELRHRDDEIARLRALRGDAPDAPDAFAAPSAEPVADLPGAPADLPGAPAGGPAAAGDGATAADDGAAAADDAPGAPDAFAPPAASSESPHGRF